MDGQFRALEFNPSATTEEVRLGSLKGGVNGQGEGGGGAELWSIKYLHLSGVVLHVIVPALSGMYVCTVWTHTVHTRYVCSVSHDTICRGSKLCWLDEAQSKGVMVELF